MVTVTGREIARVRDVIVCATGDEDRPLDEDWREHPPVGFDRHEEIDLGESVILTSLPSDEADQVMDADEPRGLNYEPVRQFGQRYSFVGERPVEAEQGAGQATFDEGGHLNAALVLSRLIRDNGFSLQYAARVSDRVDGKRIIRPIAFTEGTAVYRLRRGREWLDAAEGAELAALVEAYRAADLPPRVKRAIWRAEHSTWHRWADVTLPELVGGLEALLKIGTGQLTSQFKQRVTALARDLGIEGVDEDLCKRMYEGRSDWVHGSHVTLFGAEGSAPSDAEEEAVVADLAKMQEVLRAACRRAIEDPTFREIFGTDEAIAERWLNQ